MKIFNIFIITIISSFVAFLTVFWIGTEEAKIKLTEELPTSFMMRFAAISIIGIIGIGLLALINLVMNKTILKNHTNLKRLMIIGCTSVISVSLIGTTIFFFAF